MFCPKCGTAIENGATNCSQCGYQISTGSLIPPQEIHQAVMASKSKITAKSILCCALAAVVLVMSFYGASSVVEGGLEISRIQSVGGKTLEEAYYQSLGSIYSGYAMAIRAFGIWGASVLAYLGIKE